MFASACVMSLDWFQMMPTPIDVDAYLEDSIEYTQMHVQYPYMAMSPLSGLLTETQLNLVFLKVSHSVLIQAFELFKVLKCFIQIERW